MDSYKDIAPVTGINDSTRDSVGESAAARLLAGSGFVKAEAFELAPPASEKLKRRLLLEDYDNKGFNDFGRKPNSPSNNPVFREFDRRILDQLESIKKGPASQKPAAETRPAKEPEKQPEKKPEKQPEKLPAQSAEQPVQMTIADSNAYRAYQGSRILHHNWAVLDFDGNNAISKEEIFTAARRYEKDPENGASLAYLRDNFDIISKLYKTEFTTPGNSISQSDLKFLGTLSRAAIQDNYYHEKANNYLKAHFDKIDTDGSGTLSGTELSAAEENTAADTPENEMLRYALSRQQENYSDPTDVGYDYDQDLVSPTDLKKADLDMTLDERLTKSREDIFVQNYYKMYGNIGAAVGFAGATALIMVAEKSTGNKGTFKNWKVRNSILGGGLLVGRRAGGYVDRYASRHYFHKHQEENLKSLLDSNTGSF